MIKHHGDGALSILAVPFNGPFKGKDSDNEYFSHNTNLCLDWPPAQRPLLFDHGIDEAVGLEPIGTVDLTSARKDDAGWWIRAQLSKSSRYWLAIRELLAQAEAVLFASSGAYGHLTKRDRATGEILVWPLVEVSLTTSPSNFYARVTPEQAKAWKAAGLSVPQPAGRDVDRDHAALFREAAIAVLDARRLLERRA